jgi:hypothetical protein
MLWLADRVNIDRKLLVRAACACAKTALPYAKGDAARVAIETAESWTRGKAKIKEAKKAAADARAAAVAARGATYTADFVSAAVFAAVFAAARAAAVAADAAYDAALRQHAEIVRSIISVDVIKEALMLVA